MRRKCLQCSPKIWCFLFFEVSCVRCFAYVVISCYAKEIHAAAHRDCFNGIRQSVSVCFSSLHVDDWCTNCCISAKNENNSAILSSHISNFLHFNPTFKCFWWKCTNKNQRMWWSLCVRMTQRWFRICSHSRPDALLFLLYLLEVFQTRDVSFKSDTNRFTSSSEIFRSVEWNLVEPRRFPLFPSLLLPAHIFTLPSFLFGSIHL